MITDTLLAFGVLAALARLLRRSWTAGALLASFAFSMILCRSNVEFNIFLWMAIDLSVIAVIGLAAYRQRGLRLTDKLILALFAPVFVLYVWQPLWDATAITGIVAMQMLLTFPVRHLWRPLLRQWARFNDNFDPWADLKAYA